MGDSLEELKRKAKGNGANLVSDFIEDVKAVVKLIKDPEIKTQVQVIVTEEPATSIQTLLDQWGKWSRVGARVSSYYSEMNDNDFWITDEIGLWIEKGVSQLGINRPAQQQAIIYFYKRRHNVPMTAHAMRLGETKVRTLLSSGESWIEGYLENYKLAA